MRGAHCLKAWSQTQTTIALSSAEAELTGLVAAATQAIGLKSVASGLGIHFELHLWSDAAAAIGIARRNGLGRVRHLDVADLWIQDKIRAKELVVSKVLGSLNPADMLTKYVDSATIKRHLHTIGLSFEEGRAHGAPELTRGQREDGTEQKGCDANGCDDANGCETDNEHVTDLGQWADAYDNDDDWTCQRAL